MGTLDGRFDYITTSGSTQRTIFFCTKLMVFWTMFRHYGVRSWFRCVSSFGDFSDSGNRWALSIEDVSPSKNGALLQTEKLQYTGSQWWWTCEVADVRSCVSSSELTIYSLLPFCQPSQREKMCIRWAPTSYNLGYNSTYRGLYKDIYSGRSSIYNLVGAHFTTLDSSQWLLITSNRLVSGR